VPSPTRVGAAATANWSTGQSATLAGLSVGDILGLFIVNENSGAMTSAPATTAGSTSVWAQQLASLSISNQCGGWFYTATVNAAGSVTVGWTTSGMRGGYLFSYAAGATFGDLASKAPGSTGGGNVAMDLTSATNYSLNTLINTGPNSAVEGIVGDWSAHSTNPTAGERREADAATMTYLAHFPGNSTNYGVHGFYYPDAGAAGAKNVGFSTLRQPTVLAVEIVGPTTTPSGTGYGAGTYGGGTYGIRFVGDTSPPGNINITTITATKISRVVGKDATDVTFSADEAFVEYEIRIVPLSTSTRSEGTQVETATVTSRTSHTITLTDDELVAAAAAEGSNLCKVFVKDAAGNWST